jgi:hypothetical protein
VPLTLRLDPWTPTYESAVQLDDDSPGAPADVDPTIEYGERAWAPHTPLFVDRPKTIAFVDGVQRVEMRVIGNDNGKTIYGAFASVAVGAVLVRDGSCPVIAETPLRVLALSDGESHPAMSVPCGESTLVFQPQTTGESGLAAVHQALQDARSREEIRLGEALDAQGHEMVVVDGRLNWQPKSGAMVIGLIKTIHKQYLGEPHIGVLAALQPNTRTPIFRIGGKHAVYSWYLRLAPHRPIDHPWAGLVRLETLDSVPLDQAVVLADLTACHLPAFASASMHDPRAPQNLYPVGGLEEQLRHSLGDHEWIRRHIEMHFAREAALA